MTFDEAIDVVSMIQLLWPQAVLPKQTPKVWAEMLPDATFDDVEAAVRELAATGREFPPLVGVVVKTLADRADNLPDHDEMKAEFFRLLKRYGHDNPPPIEAYSHSLLAGFFSANHSMVWQEWCHAADGDGTFYAQQREAFKALRSRTQRDSALGLISAPRPQRLQLRSIAEVLRLPAATEEVAA